MKIHVFKSVVILLFLVFGDCQLQASDIGYPEIGKNCPDFQLNDIQYYRNPSMSLSQFKGRFVILDFWNKYCSACVKSFPKTNDLYQTYKDELDILLVGRQEAGISEMYDKFRARYDLKLPIVFDSTLYRRFVPGGAPYLVWIDDRGTVVAVTTSSDLNEDNIRHFIAGEKFRFLDQSYLGISKRYVYDSKQPFLVAGNGGDPNNFVYRSLLAEYSPGMPIWGLPESVAAAVNVGKVEGLGDLKALYRLAYFGHEYWSYTDSIYGKVFLSPSIEVDDLTVFKPDEATGSGLYWYSLIVPRSKLHKNFLQQVIQSDLRNYFGFDVKIVDREVPCWVMAVNDKAKSRLKTKRRGGMNSITSTSIILNNSPISDILAVLSSYYQFEYVFEDNSGMSENVDVSVQAVLTDMNDVVSQFAKEGIYFTLTKKRIKVLVISDPI